MHALQHLIGRTLPPVSLPSTDGATVDLRALRGHWTVLYTYPKNRVNMPGQDPSPPGWRETPGLYGCTGEACAFRDAMEEFRRLGVRVYGISTQDSAYQRTFVERFNLNFPLLSDQRLLLARSLGLPTVVFDGETLLRRITLIVDPDGVVRHAFDTPEIPDPAAHPRAVLEWLTRHVGTAPPLDAGSSPPL